MISNVFEDHRPKTVRKSGRAAAAGEPSLAATWRPRSAALRSDCRQDKFRCQRTASRQTASALQIPMLDMFRMRFGTELHRIGFNMGANMRSRWCQDGAQIDKAKLLKRVYVDHFKSFKGSM